MLNPGTLLQGRYRIIRNIGGGGMGTVYLADDVRLAGRRWAIKEMSPAQVPAQDRNWAINTFKQEAEILAGLKHSRITTITDFFPERGNWYLVMEFVEGQTLHEVLLASPGQRLVASQAIDIFEQLCDALEYLHARNPSIIFRDLKPGNVMLTPEGKIQLIDFGIARLFKPARGRDTVNLGTPGYAAPEQYGGKGQTDVRTDVYGLGVLLHQMLTGYDPTDTPFRLPPAESLNRNVPARVGQAVRQATTTDTDQRFPSVSAFRAAVVGQRTAPSPPTPVPSPPTPVPQWLIGAVGAGGVLLLIACVVVYLLTRPDSPSTPTAATTVRTTHTPTIVHTPTLAEPVTRVKIVTATTGPGTGPSVEQETVVVIVTVTNTPQTPTPTPTRTPTYTPTPTRLSLPDTFVGLDGVEMVRIPAGEFTMGSTSTQVDEAVRLCNQGKDNDPCNFGEFSNEMPQREVYLDDFYIDITEVTNAQYQACVSAGACSRPARSSPRQSDYYGNSRYADYPVINVSWSNAYDYCRWADERLPTEAEWEKAARGERGYVWPWGNDWNSSRANTNEIGAGDLAPVGSYRSGDSPYGVLDMAGNVWEWVNDWFDDDYYNQGHDINPRGPTSGSKRVVRGGGWSSYRHYARTSNRGSKSPNDPSVYTGFRCAADPP